MSRRTICSLLFAPALRPDRFAKAIAAAPDVVCFDLEDSVGERDKDKAREMLYEHAPWATTSAPLRCADGGGNGKSGIPGHSLPLHSAPDCVVRINSLRTPAGQRDLLAAVDALVPPPALMIPKVETYDELRIVADILSHARRPDNNGGDGCDSDGGKGIALHVLIETAAGIAHAPDILSGGAGDHKLGSLGGAGPELVLFGAVDLAADVGCRADEEDDGAQSDAATSPFLQYARARVVMAAVAARGGCRPALLDSPCLRLGDADALRRECERARNLGFTGKAAIHPAQLDVIHEVFLPTAVEIKRAERIVRAYASSSGAATVLDDGTVVETPVVKRAQTVLERVRRAHKRDTRPE